MDSKELKAAAEAATPGPRLFYPRHVSHADAIDAGRPWKEVAADAGHNEWLGWECNSGLITPGRGDFTGPDAVFLSLTDPAAILNLLSVQAQLVEAFKRAEEFISSFDDDNKTGDVAGILSDLRYAIARVTQEAP